MAFFDGTLEHSTREKKREAASFQLLHHKLIDHYFFSKL